VRRERAAYWLIIVIAAALRCYEAMRRPLHVDEGLSLYLAGLAPVIARDYLYSADVHPPGFTAALHLLLGLHIPDLGIRLAMAACGTLSVWLLMRLVAAWRCDFTAVAAAGTCAALMPSLIFYDGMIRMYAPFDALVLCSFLALSVLTANDGLAPQRRRALWVVWTAALALTVWVLYLGFFVIAAQLAYLAFARRDALVRGVAGAACAVALWLPQWPTFVHQMPRGGLAFAQLLVDVPAAIGQLSAQCTIAPFAGGVQLTLLSGLMWIALALTFAAAVRAAPQSLLPWLAAPAALTLSYSVLAHKALYLDRYYLIAAYALCAWSGVALAQVWRRRPQAARVIAGVFGAGLAAQAIVYAADPANYTADWAAVERQIFSPPDLRDVRAWRNTAYIFDRGTPVRVVERSGLLAGRVYAGILSPSDVDAAMRGLRPFARVWYIEYQPNQVDPGSRMIRYLIANYHSQGEWVFRRDVPGETVTIGYFVR
jgi:hypothetical protein